MKDPRGNIKISIVTAVFNRVNTITDTIESVGRQSYRNFEHVVQDGRSTDGTLERLRAAGRSIDLVSEPDTGIYDAINRGLRRAKGDVIGLMHSDDFFAHDDVLSKVVAAFNDPAIDGVYGDLQYVAADDVTKVIRHWRAGDYSPRKLRWGWMPPHPTLYLRKDVFERFGYYDTSYQIAADYEAILRFLLRGQLQLAYVPEVLVKMRVGGESNRSISRILKKSREDLRALQSNGVGGFDTLTVKNLRKVLQFFVKGK